MAPKMKPDRERNEALDRFILAEAARLSLRMRSLSRAGTPTRCGLVAPGLVTSQHCKR
jgi:phage terminase large subunit GpA-like protein